MQEIKILISALMLLQAHTAQTTTFQLLVRGCVSSEFPEEFLKCTETTCSGSCETFCNLNKMRQKLQYPIDEVFAACAEIERHSIKLLRVRAKHDLEKKGTSCPDPMLYTALNH